VANKRRSAMEQQPGDGNDLVLWAYGEQCIKLVRAELKRAHLPVSDVLVEDVAERVLVNLIRHVQRNPGRTYDNVPGYGRMTVRHVVTRVVSGRDPVPLDEAVDLEPASVDQPRNELLDSARTYVQQAGGPVWLVAAALAYLTLAAYEDVRPAGSPWPQAGAPYRTALGWPSLWLAGVRDVFPAGGKDTKRRRRNKWIARVVERVEWAISQAQAREV